MIDLNSIKNAIDFEKAVEKSLGYNVFPIKKEWVRGGMEAGWNGDPRPFGGEPEPKDPSSFIDVLEAVCPELTFLQFKRLESFDIWEESSNSSSGYYGDYTDYNVKTLNTHVLLKGLKDILIK